MDLILLGLGWVSESMARVAEVYAYIVHAVWVTIVGASVRLLEVVDDWLLDFDILDNPLMRMLVMGAVGFLIGAALMIFLCFITGNWCIPCAFVLVVGFCAFVGLVADPDQDWSPGDFPGSSGRGGPKTPLNL